MRPHDLVGASEERVLAEEPGRVAVEVDGHDVSPCLRSEQNFAGACELRFGKVRACDQLLEAK